MTFLRVKHIKGWCYLYKVKSIREGTKVKQKVVKYLGKININKNTWLENEERERD